MRMLHTTQSVVIALLLTAVQTAAVEINTPEQAQAELKRINTLLQKQGEKAALLVQRGDIYYLINDMQSAVDDYTRAILLDEHADAAYYGRGMALARIGKIKEGIADLSVYIERHPNQSAAFTKRGVRYIWLGDLDLAEHDLHRAIELDANNAEAHDDLGVVQAKKGRIKIAVQHFAKAIELDPSYQKAYHNLALSFYVDNKPQQALDMIDAGLELNQNDRNSLVLKSAILKKMGRVDEAREIEDEAEFLPEGNWTERSELMPHGN